LSCKYKTSPKNCLQAELEFIQLEKLTENISLLTEVKNLVCLERSTNRLKGSREEYNEMRVTRTSSNGS